MKTVVYIRKSTDRNDMQQQSLDIQLDWCTEYAKVNNLQIVETIIESASASKISGREGFQKLIELIESGICDTVLVYRIDRLARNPLDEGNIKWLAQQGKIKEIHAGEGIFTGKQILVLSLHMAMANQYTIDMSGKILDGIKRKLESGHIVRKAPYGYINNPLTRHIDVNEHESFFVKRIFDCRISGLSLKNIVDQVYVEGFRTRKGNKVAKTSIEAILKNPIYYGLIVHNDEKYNGVHETFISKETWDKANSIGRGITYIKRHGISPLKDMICIKIGDEKIKLSCGIKKEKYVYFFPHGDRKIKGMSFSHNQIVKEFEKSLHLYEIKDKYKVKILEEFSDYHSDGLEHNKKISTNIKKRLTILEQEKSGLIGLRRRNELTQEEFLVEKNNIIDEIEELTNNLVKINREDSNLIESFNTLVELFSNIGTYWEKCNLEGKLKVIQNLSVELIFDEQKRLHIEHKALFKALISINFNKWWSGEYERRTSLYRYFMANSLEIKKDLESIPH